MNVIGLFLLFFVLIGAAMGIFLIAGKSNVTPVDSYGATVSNETNRTAENTTTLIRTGGTSIPWIGFIVVILIIVGVFLWARSNGGNGGYNHSRYN
jgi:hypothetical protein